MDEKNKLTKEQCDCLKEFIAVGLRAQRLEVAGYYFKECLLESMAKLEGAGFQVVLQPTS